MHKTLLISIIVKINFIIKIINSLSWTIIWYLAFDVRWLSLLGHSQQLLGPAPKSMGCLRSSDGVPAPTVCSMWSGSSWLLPRPSAMPPLQTHLCIRLCDLHLVCVVCWSPRTVRTRFAFLSFERGAHWLMDVNGVYKPRNITGGGHPVFPGLMARFQTSEQIHRLDQGPDHTMWGPQFGISKLVQQFPPWILVRYYLTARQINQLSYRTRGPHWFTGGYPQRDPVANPRIAPF